MNNKTIIRRLTRVETKLSSEQKEDIVIIWSFGSEDEPHGKYGYRKFHVCTGFKEACTEEEEHEFLLEAYERIPLKARKNVDYWRSFESFLESHRCKCPLHKFDKNSRGYEIQKLLGKYEEVVDKVVNRYFEDKKQEILSTES